MPSRSEIFELINGDRICQDKSYPSRTAPPCEELRLIEIIIKQANDEWYKTEDKIVDVDCNTRGVHVNPADLTAMRKIAAVAVRCLEHWGTASQPDLSEPPYTKNLTD